MADQIKFAVGMVLGVIGMVIAITAVMNQAPTVATLTSTDCSFGIATENCTTALQNAGVTGSTLAGTVYGFVNVFWALLPLLIPVAFIGALIAKQKGYL